MKILEFARKKSTVYGRRGKLTIIDDRLSYKEGPYIDSTIYKNTEKFEKLIGDLVELTKLIDKN